MGDLDLLVDMGFDKERAQLAVKKTGNLQGAIDWLEKHQDKSVEEIKAEAEEEGESGPAVTTESLEGEEAKSLRCNECGKFFRGVAQAEFHASKTEHTDFSESTEEIKPLTEEEKAAKLEDLRVKLAAKRNVQTEQDKADKKKNEEIRRKATKESQDIREALQVKEQIKEAEKKRQEKRADDLARKKVLDQIQKDKEERKRKADLEKAQRDGTALPAAAEPAPVAAPPPPKPKVNHSEARLRLQTPEGTITKAFPAETTLFEVAHAIKEEKAFEVSSFTTNFPKKTFESSDFGMTLKEAGMVPSAAVIIR